MHLSLPPCTCVFVMPQPQCYRLPPAPVFADLTCPVLCQNTCSCVLGGSCVGRVRVLSPPAPLLHLSIHIRCKGFKETEANHNRGGEQKTQLTCLLDASVGCCWCRVHALVWLSSVRRTHQQVYCAARAWAVSYYTKSCVCRARCVTLDPNCPCGWWATWIWYM